jgi:hypothetical protein
MAANHDTWLTCALHPLRIALNQSIAKATNSRE